MLVLDRQHSQRGGAAGRIAGFFQFGESLLCHFDGLGCIPADREMNREVGDDIGREISLASLPVDFEGLIESALGFVLAPHPCRDVACTPNRFALQAAFQAVTQLQPELHGEVILVQPRGVLCCSLQVD